MANKLQVYINFIQHCLISNYAKFQQNSYDKMTGLINFIKP